MNVFPMYAIAEFDANKYVIDSIVYKIQTNYLTTVINETIRELQDQARTYDIKYGYANGKYPNGKQCNCKTPKYVSNIRDDINKHIALLNLLPEFVRLMNCRIPDDQDITDLCVNFDILYNWFLHIEAYKPKRIRKYD